MGVAEGAQIGLRVTTVVVIVLVVLVLLDGIFGEYPRVAGLSHRVVVGVAVGRHRVLHQQTQQRQQPESRQYHRAPGSGGRSWDAQEGHDQSW